MKDIATGNVYQRLNDKREKLKYDVDIPYENQPGGDEGYMQSGHGTDWEHLGKNTKRRQPSRSFSVTEETMQSLLSDCLELFPFSMGWLMKRGEETCGSVMPGECRNLMPEVFAPYSVRSAEYMPEITWLSSGGTTMRNECLYQMMCEETPSGQILFRIYEYLKEPLNALKMKGGAIVYARCHADSPDSVRYRYRLHDREASYRVPAYRLSAESKEMLCRKGLMFFLPFRYLQTQGEEWNQQKEMEEIEPLIRSFPVAERIQRNYLEICRHMLTEAANGFRAA